MARVARSSVYRKPAAVPAAIPAAMAALFMSIGGSAHAAAAAGATAAPVPADAAASAVSAGEYLADAAHCTACHTSDANKPFAGNLAIKSKFGTMYTSNITPDPTTGIGNWTEAQFTAALRLGKGQHGEYLYPAMPYTDFTKVSDADVHALWLYFRTVKPIVEKQKPNKMTFPFNVRPGIAAWQLVYFKPGRYVPDSSQSAAWNRGAYLVEGLGHCGACHTPKNFAMADKKGKDLQGGVTPDYWFAPNIGGGRFSGIRDWSEDQIVAYLKTGHNSKNVSAVGPMYQTVSLGTQNLAIGDLQAIAVYLKNQPVDKADDQTVAKTLSDERRGAGMAVYSSYCSTCHGKDGKGLDGIAPSLAGNSAVTSAGPENAMHAVLAGFPASGRWGAMPSFAQTLDSQQITDVTNYVRTAWGGGNIATNATSSGVNRMRDNADDIGDAHIQGALTCAEVPETEADPKTSTALAAIAKSGSENTVPAGLANDYRSRHPKVDASSVVNVLSGLYCRNLMALPGNLTDKQTRVIRFTAKVAAQSTSLK